MTKEELQSISIEKQEGSSVTITGEIPFTYVLKHREAAIKHIGKNMEVDGFRKGHIPESTIVERVGEMNILSEMAERALGEIYSLIIKENELEVIGHPHISITKIAPENPLGFTATVAVMPEITLPDYSAIAKDVNKTKASKEVTDEEVNKQIEDLLRQKVAYERLQKKAAQKPSEKATKDMGGIAELPTPETVSQSEDDEDLPLPELTDEYVKTLGTPGQFETVSDFKTKMREHLAVEKEREVISAHRAKITNAIIEKTAIDLPQVMIDAEINQMFAQMEDDITRAGLKMEDYLSHAKKTKEDLVSEWTPSAEKRAKLQLVLNEIAKKEDISLDTGAVDHEVSHLIETYKDADEARVRIYVESIMTNEEIMRLLEDT